jgi:putative CocE/NonD family hydrolase
MAAALWIFGGFGWGPQEETSPAGPLVQRDVMVSMRDGTQLATDVYRPTQGGQAIAGRLPVLLARTPYQKSSERANGEYYSAHGYVYVAQDTRGRYGSQGTWSFLTNDGRDGLDTLEWINRQSWSSGKVGTIGTSYVGGTQHALALARGSTLATAIPVDAVSNMGYHGMRNAGAFELRFWNWIMLNAAKGSAAALDPGKRLILQEMSENRRLYLANLPLRKGTTPLRLAPEYEDWLVEALRHGANDEYWRAADILDYTDRYHDMPVYLVGGWYDSWAGSTAANFQALSKAIRGPVYLIMGPWIHGQQGKHAHGQVEFGPDAAIPDPLAWRREWYDHWLKGVENQVGHEAPFRTKVRIFVMGGGDGRKTPDGLLNHGGSWREENEWPLSRSVPTPYYFQRNGRLASKPSDNDVASTSFVFDPRKPVPTIGGNISSGDGILLQGAWDQKGGPHVWNSPEPVPLSARNDVLVWQTAPLAQDVEVTGEVTAQLWVSSLAPDTDFTAKLVDVYPSSADYPAGFDLNIADGILRMRFRESLSEEKLIEPGSVYRATVRLYPTSNVFRKGHRIRVDISSSNFPRFDVNPNTGEPLNENRRWATATNTVHHDRSHPSQVILPIIPASVK